MRERIIGIGTDIVDVDRVINAYASPRFADKYFTKNEQKLIAIKKSRCATCFAGKEAVAKAFGTGFSGIMPVDIEILRDEFGKPTVHLYGQAREKSEALGISKIHISLSDTNQQAVAYIIALGRESHEENY